MKCSGVRTNKIRSLCVCSARGISVLPYMSFFIFSVLSVRRDDVEEMKDFILIHYADLSLLKLWEKGGITSIDRSSPNMSCSERDVRRNLEVLSCPWSATAHPSPPFRSIWMMYKFAEMKLPRNSEQTWHEIDAWNWPTTWAHRKKMLLSPDVLLAIQTDDVEACWAAQDGISLCLWAFDGISTPNKPRNSITNSLLQLKQYPSGLIHVVSLVLSLW